MNLTDTVSVLPRRRRASGTVLALMLAGGLLAGCGGEAADSTSLQTEAAAPRSASTVPSLVAPSRTVSGSSTRAVESAAPVTPAAKSSTPQAAEGKPAGAAAVLLATLPVKGRAAKTGYSRDQFGPAWTDDNSDQWGHNGCDTRNDILRRDLTDIVLKADSRGCTVLTGTLHDPYTGKTISFVRGAGTSNAVQIDHVVALSDAWQKGAQRLSASQRVDLANDPLNLLAVDGPTNASKSDGDAATWLPPSKAYRCEYVARQVAVKARYQLSVTSAERDAIARVLTACPGQQTPTEVGAPLVVPPQPKASSAPAAKPRTTSAPPVADDSPYYQNCTAVREAGKAPLRRGEPGYRSALDRDGDGIACE